MASSNKQKTDAEKKLDSDIVQMDLYGLFEVDCDATDKAILKAYRKKALKCHPDKNPDNPKAADAFHTLSKALEILTDGPARAAYDKIIKARKAADVRHNFLDTKRKKFKEDLDAKEKKVQENREKQVFTPDFTQAQKFQREVDRLRKEGSRLLEEEQERLKQEIQAEKSSQANIDATEEPPRLKLKWRAQKKDLQNGGYSEELLHNLFDKYGEISALIVSRKKLGSAIIEYCQPAAAILAHDNECGLAENPLTLSWLSGKPTNEEDCLITGSFQPPLAKPDLITGLPTSSSTIHGDASNEHGKSAPNFSAKSDYFDQFASNSNEDFESLVLRNLRQAQERKRLEQEIVEENIKN